MFVTIVLVSIWSKYGMCFESETRGKVCDPNFIGYLDYASNNCVFGLLVGLLGIKVEICWILMPNKFLGL